MSILKIREKIERKRVVRDGKKNILKKKSDKQGFKVVDGKEIKMSAIEKLNRKKGAKRGAIKSRQKKAVTKIKRAKSNKLRK